MKGDEEIAMMGFRKRSWWVLGGRRREEDARCSSGEI
jgi:hypothetical protein